MHVILNGLAVVAALVAADAPGLEGDQEAAPLQNHAVHRPQPAVKLVEVPWNWKLVVVLVVYSQSKQRMSPSNPVKVVVEAVELPAACYLAQGVVAQAAAPLPSMDGHVLRME